MPMRSHCVLVILLAGLAQCHPAAGDLEKLSLLRKLRSWLAGSFPEKHDAMHQLGDHLRVQSSSVGPFSNKWETYAYYTLPFCPQLQGRGTQPEEGTAVLPYDIKFGIDVDRQPTCSQNFTTTDVARLRKAVQEDYTIRMSMDDLPLWALIGKTVRILGPGAERQTRHYLFTHTHLDVRYHGDWVVQVDVSTDPDRAVDISNGNALSVGFSYSVHWKSTAFPFERRMERYTKYATLPQHMQARWFGIVCGGIISVQLLFILVKVLLTVSRHRRHADISTDADPEPAETRWEGIRRGFCWPAYSEDMWRHLQGDVFRPPHHPNLFAACVGTGIQILTLAFLFLALALAGAFPPYSDGCLLQKSLVLYILTAGIAGYVAAVTYKLVGGTKWLQNCLLTSTLFSSPLLLTFCVLNTIAACYHSTAAVPLAAVVGVVFSWLLLALPFTFLGSMLGACTTTASNGSNTSIPAREVPPQPWYLHSQAQLMLAGLLPFCTIFVELNYTLKSVWGHKYYISYTFMTLTFVLMVIQTAIIVVIMTYMGLSKEDHRWWWKSLCRGGSISWFITWYAVVYYFWSDMSGIIQGAYYFGFMAMTSYACFLMLGAVGFSASLIFVGTIHSCAKSLELEMAAHASPALAATSKEEAVQEC